MKQTTAKFLYDVWNAQWKNTINTKTNSGSRSTVYKEQNAYYRGITDALEIIATEAYTKEQSIRDWLEMQ